MTQEIVWANATWRNDSYVPVYYHNIPLLLPVGAKLVITRRSNKRNGTTTEIITVRVPKEK